MKNLRCAGPNCSIVARVLRDSCRDEMEAGRCLCREALERAELRREVRYEQTKGQAEAARARRAPAMAGYR